MQVLDGAALRQQADSNTHRGRSRYPRRAGASWTRKGGCSSRTGRRWRSTASVDLGAWTPSSARLSTVLDIRWPTSRSSIVVQGSTALAPRVMRIDVPLATGRLHLRARGPVPGRGGRGRARCASTRTARSRPTCSATRVRSPRRSSQLRRSRATSTATSSARPASRPSTRRSCRARRGTSVLEVDAQGRVVSVSPRRPRAGPATSSSRSTATSRR